ncbi:MAG: hypothetical protein OYH77_00015 [Pseudomonadota bacterium]|nr:hypothetical protein [Pseudomonadota bacterium]
MIRSHALDFLAHAKGREHPVLRLDRAFDFVSNVGSDVLSSDEWVFLDPFCVAGELMLAMAGLMCGARDSIDSIAKIGEFMHLQNRFHMLSPNVQSYYVVRKVFCSSNEYKARNIFNAGYLSEDGYNFDREVYKAAILDKVEALLSIPNKKIMVISSFPCQSNFNSMARYIYKSLVSLMMRRGCIDQMLVLAPERWFSNKEKFKQSKEVQSGMLKYIRVKNSRWLFPHHRVREGLCYMHFDRSFEGAELIIDRGNRRRSVAITRGFTNKIVSSILRKIS